jgi:hypothetical protein
MKINTNVYVTRESVRRLKTCIAGNKFMSGLMGITWPKNMACERTADRPQNRTTAGASWHADCKHKGRNRIEQAPSTLLITQINKCMSRYDHLKNVSSTHQSSM